VVLRHGRRGVRPHPGQRADRRPDQLARHDRARCFGTVRIARWATGRAPEIPGLGSAPSRALRLIGAVGGARETRALPADRAADQGCLRARSDSPCANLASSDRARRPA
jgi:hypothetical protein